MELDTGLHRYNQYIYRLSFNVFFQAEDGIRDVERSRGLGDVYKRQIITCEVRDSCEKPRRADEP